MTGVDLVMQDVSQCKVKDKVEKTNLDRTSSFKFDETLENLKNMKNTNSFMLMTINRIIDFAKASKGLKLIPKFESIDFKETLELPLRCMSNIQERIEIELLPYGNICSHIITDKQWLQENILCLLSNAVKYSSRGKVMVRVRKTDSLNTNGETCQNRKSITSPRIPATLRKAQSAFALSTKSRRGSLSLVDWFGFKSSDVQRPAKIVPSDIESQTAPISPNKCPNKFLLIEIIDQGIGMSEEAMRTLFSPFKQTQRLAGGTGLGLYSLSKRIDALQGQYGVKKRDDGLQGSVFWFTIPYRPDKVNNEIVNQEESLHLRSSVKASNRVTEMLNSESKTILLVEDTPSIAKMTSMMLRKLGHKVTVAENGEIAFQAIIEQYEHCDHPEKKKFDVVLMDLQMPVMDGLEATRRLRAYEKSYEEQRNISIRQVVIGVTAAMDEETFEEGKEMGIDDFLPKPFTGNDLKDLFKKYKI